MNFAIYRLNSVNPGLLPLSIFLLFSRDLHVVLASEVPVQDLLSWVTPGLVASSRDLLPHVSIHLCQVCPELTAPPVLTSLSQPLLGTLGSSGNCWMLTVLQGVGKCLSHPRRPARSKLRILSTLKSFCIPAGNFSSSQLTEESGHRVQSFLRRLSISVSCFSCAPMDCSPSGSSVHGDSSGKNAGLTFPSPGDLPDPGIEPGTPALQADSLPSEPPGKPLRHLSAFKF